MTPAEVATLLRLWIDEPDTSFITDAHLEVMLDAAYEEFRGLVTTVDPAPYMRTATLTFSGTRTFDLATTATSAGILLGASAIAAKLVRIVDLVELQNGDLVRRFTAVPTVEAIETTPDSYSLFDTTLSVSITTTGTLTMYYIAKPAITWTGGSPTTFLDDFDEFHELIALLAYQRYAIRDGAGNKQLNEMLARRYPQFQAYLYHRLRGKGQHVRRSLTLRYS